MDNFIEKLRNTFLRTADRLTGRHVPVQSGRESGEQLRNRRLMRPPVDILENEDEVVIVADTPGAFPDNTWLHWDEESVLSLHVQRKGTSHRWLFGDDLESDWYRALEIPDYLDPGAARASLKAGVLEIQIPKRDQPAPISIPITVS
jgi:HSP20 family molecular chaperone IbpA